MASAAQHGKAQALKFVPFKSDIELDFYASLANHKINHDKLNDAPRRVVGLYENRPKEDPGPACRMKFHGSALASDELVHFMSESVEAHGGSVQAGMFRAEGMVRNMNTIEDYRKLDMNKILQQAGRTIWEAINDGTIYSCPSLLVSLTMLFFADLKKYNFTFVCGFPALHSDPPWLMDEEGAATPLRLTLAETSALVDTVGTWKYGVDSRQYGFFLAKRVRGASLEQQGDNSQDDRPEDEVQDDDPDPPGNELDFEWVIGSIGKFESGFFQGVSEEDQFICFADPSTSPQHPGWMLRNLLVLVRRRWNMKKAQILCYRDSHARRHEAQSLILRIHCGNASVVGKPAAVEAGALPTVTGWEKNDRGKIVHRITNLADYMNPQRLAEQAVDLNLKLIKWRISPNLNLDVVKNTKCLLLGAGTLGSYVSRILLGWGVRHITFVDNGKVSFSNPVRQPLFNYQDCLDGGRPKAVRAAEALREIFPGVTTAGHVLSVPMAGHPIMDEAKVRKDFDELQALINDHDVTFLLMDTRESRWLPTVIGKATGKLVMNAALGFDTFVILRHGVKKLSDEEVELGCYFCNDVVAPADSLSDRTLDQQCTVTRPGAAAIASAMLVELMVSVLQHKDGAHAAAPLLGKTNHEEDDHPLGDVPHQVRGYLRTFSNTVVTGKSYDCCSACSDRVTDAYSKDGWEFVKKVLNEKGYVEEISGLAEVQKAAEKALVDIEWDVDDQEEDNSEAELL